MRIAHVIPAALIAGAILTSGTAAEARDGCGPGFHRGFYGYCRPNPFVRPFAFRPGFYGYRRVGWGGGWHRGWHGGWHGGWRRW